MCWEGGVATFRSLEAPTNGSAALLRWSLAGDWDWAADLAAPPRDLPLDWRPREAAEDGADLDLTATGRREGDGEGDSEAVRPCR